MSASRYDTDALFRYLDSIGVDHHTVEHVPLYTVEQSRQLRGELPGAHCKNLFLRNKKGKMWLLTCLEDRLIDLKELRIHLGTNSLSFASADRLMHYLGVIPGAVSPFGLINDDSCEVTFVIDAALLRSDTLNFHPLDNARTTAISASALLRFLESTGHAPLSLDLG